MSDTTQAGTSMEGEAEKVVRLTRWERGYLSEKAQYHLDICQSVVREGVKLNRESATAYRGLPRLLEKLRDPTPDNPSRDALLAEAVKALQKFKEARSERGWQGSKFDEADTLATAFFARLRTQAEGGGG